MPLQEARFGAGLTPKAPHLLALVRKRLERIYDEPRGGAVEDVDAWRADPCLQVVHGHRNVLRVGFVEDPDLAVDRRPRDAVPIVVEQHPFVLPQSKHGFPSMIRKGTSHLHIWASTAQWTPVNEGTVPLADAALRTSMSYPACSTFAVLRQEMASFFTSSMVGSRWLLYLARGCHRSYCACRFLPAPQTPCLSDNRGTQRKLQISQRVPCDWTRTCGIAQTAPFPAHRSSPAPWAAAWTAGRPSTPAARTAIS